MAIMVESKIAPRRIDFPLFRWEVTVTNGPDKLHAWGYATTKRRAHRAIAKVVRHKYEV